MCRRGDADGEGEDGGGEVDDDEDRGEPEGEFGWIVAEEHVEVDGGDGVEEGTTGDEEGLDDHRAVVRQNQRNKLLVRNSVEDVEM